LDRATVVSHTGGNSETAYEETPLRGLASVHSFTASRLATIFPLSDSWLKTPLAGSGFTLIELLVVIAIIAILAAMLRLR
jgi:prepilin-type N-terminal cleavage/methylation domain-containing protein